MGSRQLGSRRLGSRQIGPVEPDSHCQKPLPSLRGSRWRVSRAKGRRGIQRREDEEWDRHSHQRTTQSSHSHCPGGPARGLTLPGRPSEAASWTGTGRFPTACSRRSCAFCPRRCAALWGSKAEVAKAVKSRRAQLRSVRTMEDSITRWASTLHSDEGGQYPREDLNRYCRDQATWRRHQGDCRSGVTASGRERPLTTLHHRCSQSS